MGAFWHEAGLVQLTTIKPGAYQRCPARGLGVNPYPPDPWAHLKNPAPPRTCHSHSHTHTPMSTPTSAHRIFKNKQEKGSCEGSTRGARARGACANSPTRQEKGVGEGGRRERERERETQAGIHTHTYTHTSTAQQPLARDAAMPSGSTVDSLLEGKRWGVRAGAHHSIVHAASVQSLDHAAAAPDREERSPMRR